MGEKVLKPSLRFKGFTDAWEQRKLENFGVACGGTSLEKEFREKGQYKVISIGSYSENNKYIDQGLRANFNDKTKKYVLSKDDLTMVLNDKTLTGNIIGRVLIIDENKRYIYNQRTERIIVNSDSYDSSFLYALLNADHIRNKIVRAAQGNTQIYVNWSTISKMTYLIPQQKNEQNKIATFCNYLDSLITLHQRKYEELQNVKKSLLQKMFPENNEDKPKVRFKGFTDAWEQRIVGNCIASIPTKEYIVVPQTRGRYPVYQQGDNPIAGYTDEKPCEYINVVLFGDHTLSIYKPESPYMLATDGIKILKSENFDSIFFMHYLEKYKPISEGYKRHFSILRNIPSYYPLSTKEQKNIGLLFNYIDSLITLHQRKYEKLQNIKKSLLERMFV